MNRLTDVVLVAAIALAVYGAVDPAGAVDLLSAVVEQLRSLSTYIFHR